MTGQYQHTIDAKGRLFIPAKLREELGDTFYVTMGMDSCLSVYSDASWARFTEKFEGLPYTKTKAMRPLFANAAKCEPDSQGRILLRPDQRALVDQLRHFPLADHDDGPDALEMLWRAASQGYVSLRDAFVRVPRARSPFESVPQDDAPMPDDPLENGWI